MSDHRYTFPPPPPAPSGASQPFAGLNGYSGIKTRGGYDYKGNARGSNRGGQKAEQFGSSQSTSSYGNLFLGVDKTRSPPPNMGYNVQISDNRRTGYPFPSYPPVQLPQYPTNLRQGYGPQNPAVPANARTPQAAYLANGNGSSRSYPGQQQYSSHGYGPSLSTIQPPLPASQRSDFFEINAHVGQPILMGPPIRMGFDVQRNDQQARQYAQPTAKGANAYQHGLSNCNDSPYRQGSPMGPNGFPSGHHESPNIFPTRRGRGQKRGHGEDFNRTRKQTDGVQVAPAVPSFGGLLHLPMKPPVLHENTRKPRKKKRKHNQLGLTPKAEEHESSDEEEDDDANEEVRLAAVAGRAGQGPQLLQFDYKGRTSTLKSSSDITAWIEERKKRFPTKARAVEIAAVKRQREEQQRATNQARIEAQEKHRTVVRERQTQKTEREQQPKKGENASEDAAAKSKRKVEKLRKRLEKEEKRIAKAETKAYKDDVESSTKKKKRKRSDSGGSGNREIEDTDLAKPKLEDTASIVPDPLTPISQPAPTDEERNPSSKDLIADDTPGQGNCATGQEGDGPSFSDIDRLIQNSSDPLHDSSSDSSSTDSQELTSSSGSSSDDESHNEAPDEISTKRNGGDRLAPPKRAKPKQICREFLNKGLCKRGSHCKYLHDLPERGSRRMRTQDNKGGERRKERLGLYQRLLEQDKEQEDYDIMEAILHLGEKGLLEKGQQARNGEGKPNECENESLQGEV